MNNQPEPQIGAQRQYNILNDIKASEDAYQIIFSTKEQPLKVKSVKAETRAIQWLCQASDETLQVMVRSVDYQPSKVMTGNSESSELRHGFHGRWGIGKMVTDVPETIQGAEKR